jgi:hypothetical protein
MLLKALTIQAKHEKPAAQSLLWSHATLTQPLYMALVFTMFYNIFEGPVR